MANYQTKNSSYVWLSGLISNKQSSRDPSQVNPLYVIHFIWFIQTKKELFVSILSFGCMRIPIHESLAILKSGVKQF